MTELVRASFDFFEKENIHRKSLVDEELYQIHVDIPQDCIELWERYYRLYDKQWWLDVFYHNDDTCVTAFICGDEFDDINITDLLPAKFIRLIYEYVNWNKKENESEEKEMKENKIEVGMMIDNPDVGRLFVAYYNEDKDRALLINTKLGTSTRYIGAWGLQFNTCTKWSWSQGHYFMENIEGAVNYVLGKEVE